MGSMADDGDHYRLAFDRPDTWSQKYNLVWDRLLGFHLFPAEIAPTEIAFYLTAPESIRTSARQPSHIHKAGLDDLDGNAGFESHRLSKPSWHPIFLFLNQTPDRFPMTDWYDTISGRQVGFQARSVVGGVYIKMIADPELWSKWVTWSRQKN